MVFDFKCKETKLVMYVYFYQSFQSKQQVSVPNDWHVQATVHKTTKFIYLCHIYGIILQRFLNPNLNFHIQ